MQICPQCGYRGGFNWPMALWGGAFLILEFLWAYGDYGLQGSRSDRLWALAAFLMFNAGTIWLAVRGLKHAQQHRLNEGMQQIEREKQVEGTQRAKT